MEFTSLYELSETKKDCYKTYMVTYQTGDWIKAIVHLREGFMESCPSSRLAKLCL